MGGVTPLLLQQLLLVFFEVSSGGQTAEELVKVTLFKNSIGRSAQQAGMVFVVWMHAAAGRLAALLDDNDHQPIQTC
jgi:hypothetical protein